MLYPIQILCTMGPDYPTKWAVSVSVTSFQGSGFKLAKASGYMGKGMSSTDSRNERVCLLFPYRLDSSWKIVQFKIA